jgi:hypothetical protein
MAEGWEAVAFHQSYWKKPIKWDAPLGLDFGLGLLKLHTMTVQVERPWGFMAKGANLGLDLWKLHTMLGQRLQFLYFIGYVFSARFFGLSTKFGLSIPRPLDLVKKNRRYFSTTVLLTTMIYNH